MEPATIVRHLAFRNVAAQLDVAFVTFYRQLRRLSVLSQRLSHLEKLFPFKMVNKWWPEGRSYWDVTRDVGLAHEKKPQSSPEMTWLVWPSSHQPEFRDRSEFIRWSVGIEKAGTVFETDTGEPLSYAW